MTEIAPSPTTLVGHKAPEFAAQGYFKGELKSFKLSDYEGRWTYLLFYPLDFTFVCPTEVLSFSKMMPQFREKKCQVLGISVDSQFTHKAWVETGNAEGGLGGSLEYPLLADLDKKIGTSFGVINDAGVALRGLFLIDPKGVVMHATINNLPVGRSAGEALRTLKAFQFVAANDGQVCPADWDEGKETMGASPEGMRKYLTSRR